MNWLIDIDGLVKIDTPRDAGGQEEKKQAWNVSVFKCEQKSFANSFLLTTYFNHNLVNIDNY